MEQFVRIEGIAAPLHRPNIDTDAMIPSREITSLLEQGVFVTSNRPNYYYTRLGELKLEMLAEAAKDARSRAENILRSAGNTGIGPLVDSSMGIININPANSTGTTSWDDARCWAEPLVSGADKLSGYPST
mgnify:CR=1 FL=1